MRISHQLVPPGGWEFQEGTTKFKESTFDLLVKIVLLHRNTNDIPIGNPIEDIEDQIAEKYPHLIINNQLKKKPMGVSFYQTVQSFVQFLLNWSLKGGQLVDQNTANTRAAICVACHNCRPSTETRAKTCCGGNKVANAVLNRVRAQIIRENKTTSESKLLTCLICGCDLKISVWIPNEVLLKSEDANAYPTHCWKKAILNGKDI